MDFPFQVCPEISNPAAAAAAGSDGCHIIRADHYPRRTANLGPRGRSAIVNTAIETRRRVVELPTSWFAD